MSHLQEQAMLVNLSISSWTASKKDRTASRDVKASKGATEKAGWFNKRLVDPTSLQAINNVEGRARALHYSMTLPWGDNGDRILPAQAYMDYVDQLRALRTEFEGEVNTFVKNYPQLVQDARKMLGAMYEPGDYPEPHQIKHRFDMRSVFTPVPDAKDFRVDVGDEAVAEIKRNIAEAVEQRLVGATRECWVRLEAVVGKMAETLLDPDQVFRDSLVDNIRTLVAMLPKLNITNDMALDNVVHEAARWLVVDTESLRKDKKFRAFTCEKAIMIVEMIKPWTKTT
jgi:hypothetical protein